MLPSFLIQALFALGGVCFILSPTIFHYFKNKVDQHISERMSIFFSSPTTEEIVRRIKEGTTMSALMKDFNNELFKIAEPRRKLLSLLSFFPLAGGLFLLSASLACVTGIEDEAMSFIANTLEIIAVSTLLVALAIIAYCCFQLVKLARELA